MTTELNRAWIGGICYLIIGAVAAAAMMMRQSVENRPVREEMIVPGVHYVDRGQAGSGDSWRQAWQSWQGGASEVVIGEADLNAWAVSVWGEQTEEEAKSWLRWSRLDFYFPDDGRIQVSGECKFEVSLLAHSGLFVGIWDAGNSSLRPTRAWIGQFPVGFVPVFGPALTRWLTSSAFSRDSVAEFREEFAALGFLSVTESTVRVGR